MNKNELFKDIHNQMKIINMSLAEGEMATINTEILIAQIKGNESVQSETRGLDVVAKYYIDVFEKIKECQDTINNDLSELEKLDNNNNK